MASRKQESVLDAETRPADEAQRLRTLVEASSALLGSASVEEILPQLLELARRTLQADAYALWEHDLDTDEWHVAAHAGLSDEYVEEATAAIRGQPTLVSLDEPLIVEDIATTEWLKPAHREAHLREGNDAMLAAGLVHRGKVLGTLTFYYREPHEFTEPERSAASTLANLAAAAVATTRLYEQAQERAHAALVVEHVADGVVLVDHEGVVHLWNPAAERITGLAAQDVVGRRADSVFSSWDAISPLAGTGASRAETLPTEVDGRELWLSITGVAFEGGCVYAFRDLTAERAVDRLKSDFVATVSHELRTPLAAIYGAALTLRRDDVSLGEPQRTGLLEVIATESDRLARIVNDILFASRIESGTMQTTIEHCDVGELARSVVDAAAQYVPPNVTLALFAPPDIPAVAADSHKVRQVIANLIDNAIKYSPDGGSVAVAIERVGEDVLRVYVRDDGLGIPAGEHGRIFEKFYRLDPNLTRGVGGTGLGLYISRELVERMGGRIWVEPTVASGSTFAFELPVAS